MPKDIKEQLKSNRVFEVFACIPLEEWHAGGL